jgi:predicted transglutaminase-like cysteine proteinase
MPVKKPKPKFDPNKPFEVVDTVEQKPKFDPNKPFTVVEKKSPDKDENPEGLFVEPSTGSEKLPELSPEEKERQRKDDTLRASLKPIASESTGGLIPVEEKAELKQLITDKMTGKNVLTKDTEVVKKSTETDKEYLNYNPVDKESASNANLLSEDIKNNLNQIQSILDQHPLYGGQIDLADPKNQQARVEVDRLVKEAKEKQLSLENLRKQKNDPYLGMTDEERKDVIANKKLTEKYSGEVKSTLDWLGYKKKEDAKKIELTPSQTEKTKSIIQDFSEYYGRNYKGEVTDVKKDVKDKLKEYLYKEVYPRFKEQLKGYEESDWMAPFMGSEKERPEHLKFEEGLQSNKENVDDAMKSFVLLAIASEYEQDPVSYLKEKTGVDIFKDAMTGLGTGTTGLVSYLTGTNKPLSQFEVDASLNQPTELATKLQEQLTKTGVSVPENVKERAEGTTTDLLASTAQTSAEMIPSFVITELATGGGATEAWLAKGLGKALDWANKAKKSGNVFQKTTAFAINGAPKALTSGLKYEATGQLFGGVSDTIKEEANFFSGLAGGMGEGLAVGFFNKLSGIKTIAGNKLLNYLSGSVGGGVGETAEEMAQAFVDVVRTSEGDEFLDNLKEQFTGDNLADLALASFVMGAFMKGSGKSVELMNNYKETYNKLSPEQKAVVDSKLNVNPNSNPEDSSEGKTDRPINKEEQISEVKPGLSVETQDAIDAEINSLMPEVSETGTKDQLISDLNNPEVTPEEKQEIVQEIENQKTEQPISEGEINQETIQPTETTQEGILEPKKEVVNPFEVFITPATKREFSEETKVLKEKTQRFDEINQNLNTNIETLSDEEVDTLSSERDQLSDEILGIGQKLIENEIKDLQGVKVTGLEPQIGQWDGSSEPSWNLKFEATNDGLLNMQDKLADFAEKTSQDAFFTTSELTRDEALNYKQIDTINGVTEDGATIMPQYSIKYKKPLTNKQKLLISRVLKNNNIKEFSLDKNGNLNLLYFDYDSSQRSISEEEINKRHEDYEDRLAKSITEISQINTGENVPELEFETRKSWASFSDLAYSGEQRRPYQSVRSEISQKREKLKPNQSPSNEGGKTPPAPTNEVSNKEPEKLQRSFPKQLDKDESLSEEVKLSEEGRYYYRKSNKETNAQANDIIAEVGLEKSVDALMDMKNDIPDRVRVALAFNIIKQANKIINDKNTSEADKKKFVNLTIKVADFTSILGTELGQGIQAYSIYSRLSPEGVLAYVQREIKKSNDQKLEQAEPTLEKVKEILDRINPETLAKVFELPKIQELINDKSIKVKNTTKKAAVKKAIDKLDGLIARLEKESKGKAFDAMYGLSLEAAKAILKTVRAALQTGLTISQAINKSFNEHNKKNPDAKFDQEGFKNFISDELKDVETVLDPENAVKRELKDQDVNIKDLIKKHYTEVDRTKKSLTDKLVSEAGLSEADAKEVAKSIEEAFDKLSTKAKTQELNKLRSLKEKTFGKRKTDQLHEKIIKQSNLGVLSDQELREIYSDKMELPKLTEEQAQKLMNLAEKVQTAKEGEQKNKATQDLLKYQEKIKGLNWADVGSSVWYANILSGPSTQVQNAVSGLMEILGEVAVSTVQNPKNTGFLLSNLFQGWGRGALQGLDVLKTGHQPEKGTKMIDVPSTLEKWNFKGGNWNPFNYPKYVSRLMTAVDMFHFSGLKQMRSAELAMSMAQKEGKDKPNMDIKKRAVEILNNSKERIQEAKDQAKAEGLKGNEYKRRVFEIIEQSRPESMNEDANNFAAHGTFNYQPEGVLGALTNSIESAKRNVKETTGVDPLMFIVPFTRIVANVTNRALDWTPHGFLRWYKKGMGAGKFGSNKWSTKYTPEERQKELIKATLGTIGMAALWALSDDDEIEITADGTGDTKKNYQLQETGWRPYSIRIGDKWYSYQNTPLQIPFATIGFAKDAQKYKGEKDIESKVSLSMLGGSKYIMDMNFLSSLSGFFSAFSKDNPNGGQNFMDKLEKEAGRTGKSFVVPNLFTQSSRAIQEIYEMPMKRANGVMDEITRDMPFFRDNLNNMYNTLGDPVIADQTRKFFPFKVKSDENNKVWDLIVDNQAYIGSPSRNTIIYDSKTDSERNMTDEEYNDYSIKSGQLIKKMILEEFDDLKKMSKREVQDRIKKIVNESRTEIKQLN